MALVAVSWVDVDTGARIDKTSLPGNPDAYAIRFSNIYCLSKSEGWIHEPLPSNRDDSFFVNCRWSSLEKAEASLKVADCSIFSQ